MVAKASRGQGQVIEAYLVCYALLRALRAIEQEAIVHG
jgi:hypothetical protein